MNMECMYLFKLVFSFSLDKYPEVELLGHMIEINPLMCGESTYNEGGKNIQWEKDHLFNKRCWENWTSTCERMKLDHYLP